MVKVPVTILGGLPVIAEVWFSGPDYEGEYDAGVDCLYWQRRDGTCGKPLSQKVIDRVEKEAYWQAYVTEQANDWLSLSVPVRRRNPHYTYTFPANPDNPEYIEEGEYSPEYLKLNPRSHDNDR